MEGRNLLVEKGMWLVEKEKGSRSRKGSGKVDRGCGLLVSRGFFGFLWVLTDISFQ